MPTSHMAEPPDLEWCTTCNRLVEVGDRSDEVTQEYAGQRGVHVIHLFCGHDITHPDGTFYPFP